MTKPSRTKQLNEILKLLAQTKEEITRRLAPHAENVPHRDVRGNPELGERDYATDLTAYIAEVENVRRDVDPQLTMIAEKIAQLGGKNWSKDDDIVQAWMALAHVVQTLRHNPAKGPGVVYVNEDNKLISFAAANFWLDEMQPSARLKRNHLTYEDGRAALNICAEPAAIAKAVGHGVLATHFVLRSKKSVRNRPKAPASELGNKDYIGIERVAERRVRFLDRVSSHARRSGLFTNAVLITTADPCRSCTQAVVDVGVAEVISDVESHRHPMKPKRMAEMQQAHTKLHAHHIAHRHIVYRHNI